MSLSTLLSILVSRLVGPRIRFLSCDLCRILHQGRFTSLDFSVVTRAGASSARKQATAKGSLPGEVTMSDALREQVCACTQRASSRAHFAVFDNRVLRPSSAHPSSEDL